MLEEARQVGKTRRKEEVKQKFLFELSHPLHAKVDVIEKCAKNIAESLVLSDYEKERMLKALKQK